MLENSSFATSNESEARTDEHRKDAIPLISIGITVPPLSCEAIMKLQVPAENSTSTSFSLRCPSYEDYIETCIGDKKESQPWLSDAQAIKSAKHDLKGVLLGFPGVCDAGYIRSMTAYFGYICDIDTAMEAMSLQEMEKLVYECLAILNGEPPNDMSHETPTGKAGTITRKLYTIITSLLPSAASAAALSAIRDMIAGQLQERTFLESKVHEPDARTYLDLRMMPFGLFPLLTMAEYYFIPDGAPPNLRPDIHLIKRQVVYVSTIQNDCVGIPKDLKDSVQCNTVFHLARLKGTPILEASDVLERQKVLDEVEALHNGLIQQVISTYLRLQRLATSDEHHMFIFNMLDICRRQLQWTIGTPRYKLEV